MSCSKETKLKKCVASVKMRYWVLSKSRLAHPPYWAIDMVYNDKDSANKWATQQRNVGYEVKIVTSKRVLEKIVGESAEIKFGASSILGGRF